MLNKGVRRDEEGFIPPGHINSSLRRKWENRRVNPPRCIEKGKTTRNGGGVTLLIASEKGETNTTGRVNPPRCIEKRENKIALPVASKMGKPTQRGGVTLLIASKWGNRRNREG